MKKVIPYGIILGAIALFSILVGFDSRQVLALVLFSSMVLGTLFFWAYRLVFAFLAVGVFLALGLLDVPHIVEFANLDVILFLVGTMLVVGFLEERGFFEHILEALLGRVGNDVKRVTVLLMVIAAISSALVGEVTSILFIMAVTFRVVDRFGLKPVPFLMMMVFATNIGSTATVVGNPIGVMLALRGGLTFMDFLRWATPIAFFSLLPLTIFLSILYFRQDLVIARPQAVGEKTRGGFFSPPLRACWALFGAVTMGLVLHAPLENLLELPKNTLLLGVALLGGGVALALARGRARDLVERRVDWWTLAFFLFLFISVGVLQAVGVTEVFARWIQEGSGGQPTLAFLLVTGAAGFLTAFLDNVLAVATFVPVVHSLAETGMDAFPLWWGLLFAGTVAGNATMIGSTANIVAIGMMERQGKGHITFGQWIKPGLLVTLPTLAVALLLILLQTALFR